MTSQIAQVLFSDDQIKQLRHVIREEVETESKEVKRNITMNKLGLINEIYRVGDRVKNVEIEVSNIHKGVLSLKNGQEKLDAAIEQNKKELINVIENSTEILIRHMSKGYNQHEEQICIIEKRLGFLLKINT